MTCARRGGEVVTGAEVLGGDARRGGDGACELVRGAGWTLRARRAIACAGAWADRLAVASGAPAEPRIVPFRGAYARLAPDARRLVRALIYPVPDPALPFLGVHFTRGIDGEVHVGPTALLAGARDAYSLRTLRARRRRRDARLAGDAGGWRGAGGGPALHELAARG